METGGGHEEQSILVAYGLHYPEQVIHFEGAIADTIRTAGQAMLSGCQVHRVTWYPACRASFWVLVLLRFVCLFVSVM